MAEDVFLALKHFDVEVERATNITHKPAEVGKAVFLPTRERVAWLMENQVPFKVDFVEVHRTRKGPFSKSTVYPKPGTWKTDPCLAKGEAPVLCGSGWHVWYFTLDELEGLRGMNPGSTSEAWVVAVKGKVTADSEKAAFAKMKLVKRLDANTFARLYAIIAKYNTWMLESIVSVIPTLEQPRSGGKLTMADLKANIADLRYFAFNRTGLRRSMAIEVRRALGISTNYPLLTGLDDLPEEARE